jgi:RNA polymerase sigma-70 factor (ECF subfamily)
LAWEQRVAAVEAAGDVDMRVFEALASLSEADQELLLLVAWDGLSREQIAAVLEIPRGTVAVRVHRARRRFARAFDRMAATEGPGSTAVESGGFLR